MTPVYTHIHFRADVEKDDPDPPGGWLLDYLEEDLVERDVWILERGTTDYSHTFHIATAKHVFVGMVGEGGDGGWLLFVESSLSWWQQLLRISDEAEHQKVMLAIVGSLQAHPAVGRIVMYRDADSWNLGTEGVEAT